MITYILFLTIGILIFILLNLKERFLIPFNLNGIIRCKNADPKIAECNVRGDCEEQCYGTLFYEDKDIYDRLWEIKYNRTPEVSQLEWFRMLQELLNEKYNITEEQNFPNTGEYNESIPEQMWITTKGNILRELVNIFSNIPVDSGANNGNFRLIYLAIDNRGWSDEYRYSWHFVIFARYSVTDNMGRTTYSLYMLDPKHRVVNKNSDIFHEPWFKRNFHSDEEPGKSSIYESFDWSEEDFATTKRVYFVPIMNQDATDINPNKDREEYLINQLLTAGDNVMNEQENATFQHWIRRTSDGIVDPNKAYFCASAGGGRYSSSAGGYGGDYSTGGASGIDTSVEVETEIQIAIRNRDIKIPDTSSNDLELDEDDLYTYREVDESLYLLNVPLDRRDEIIGQSYEELYVERNGRYRYIR